MYTFVKVKFPVFKTFPDELCRRNTMFLMNSRLHETSEEISAPSFKRNDYKPIGLGKWLCRDRDDYGTSQMQPILGEKTLHCCLWECFCSRIEIILSCRFCFKIRNTSLLPLPQSRNARNFLSQNAPCSSGNLVGVQVGFPLRFVPRHRGFHRPACSGD